MYHTVEFNVELAVDLEISPKKPLERLSIHRGSRRRAQIKPYVIETAEGPTEVADLFFDDGTATRQIRFECFSFVE
jgi:hypothetical protein